MKKFNNNSQVREKDNSLEGANNEIYLCSVTDTQFKKEIVKILKELGANMKELKQIWTVKQITLERKKKIYW